MESVPDKVGTVAGYRVWRVIPDRWVDVSRSLYPKSCDLAWSSTGPTVAHCPSRTRAFPESPPATSGASSTPRASCSFPPGFDCVCGLYVRYEPPREAPLLPYVAGSVLAWGRVVHHAERSFFRVEKALPVAFVRPGGGSGLFPEEAEAKLLRIADTLGAEVVGGPEELQRYTEKEAGRW